jgi:hypothetical protein
VLAHLTAAASLKTAESLSQDIRRPLTIEHADAIDIVTHAAQFYAKYDFTVPSKSIVHGLRLQATDGPFSTGTGSLVSGATLALVMTMAGRASYCDQLTGDGVPTLRGRLRSEDALPAEAPDSASRDTER